jgi:hypothetical protein
MISKSQLPARQTLLAPTGGTGQRLPHAPQLFGSPEAAVSAVSQPLVASLSQLPKPAAQSKRQAPATHAGVTFCLPPAVAVHEVEHAPQRVASLWVFTSQPLPAAPSQSAKPAEHARRHAPS